MCPLAEWTRSLNQRIAHAQAREPAEVTIGAPQFTHAMAQAQRGDARIVDDRPLQLGLRDQIAQLRPVLLVFGQQVQRRRSLPEFDLRDGFGWRTRRGVGAKMRGDKTNVCSSKFRIL